MVYDSLLKLNPGDVVGEVIKTFTDALQKDLDKKRNLATGAAPDAGWELLNTADFMSTRQFFRS